MSRIFDQRLAKIVHNLCGLDTPVCVKAKQAFAKRDWAELFGMKIAPSDYSSWIDYLVDAQAVSFLKKLDAPELLPDVDLEQKARATFVECEQACAATNARLARFIYGGPLDLPDMRVWEVISYARKVISDVIGPLPDHIDGRFGPGSTVSDLGPLVSVPDKLTIRPTATPLCRALIPLWEGTAWARALAHTGRADPVTVRGNRFTSVPKDATKRRGICIEPSLNVFLQLGVGRVLRRRLRRVGIDLDNGQQVHREMAREASLTESHATIDLSNASDTVAYNLVRLLLPTLWFELLDSLRSPFTSVDGRNYRLSKFSSMGNGFTFELETLLYFGIATAIIKLEGGDGSAWVYGDDIIVPSAHAPGVMGALRFFGFTPNETKTFSTGPFRESCGGDFFEGKAVRPYFLKELPHAPEDWISLANGLYRVLDQVVEGGAGYASYADVLRRCRLIALGAIPSQIRRLRGPRILGDLVIHDDDGWVVREPAGKPWQWEIRCWVPVRKVLPWHHWRPEVIFASALYGCLSSGVTPRGAVSGYRMEWLSCLERCNRAVD